MFWSFLRSPARAPTVKAVRGTFATKGIFSNLKGPRFLLLGGHFPLTGPSVLLTGDPFPYGPCFNCLIVGLGPGL